MANRVVFEGSWVPCFEGTFVVEGMSMGDLVVLRGRQHAGRLVEVEARCDGRYVIPGIRLASAERRESSGEEITVWVT